MFNQNGLGDGKLLYNNKDISPETKKEEESASIYSSNKYNNPLPIFISQNKNIVKTIKGGHG